MVLNNLNFSVGPAQSLEIVGPNGSGKTTLLRTLAGIEPLAGGELSIPEAEVAYLGHRDGLKEDLTVADNLKFWAGIYGARIDNGLLRQFGFCDLEHRLVRHLSAGQRKRAALISLIASNQRIWLMDEPMAALDARWAGAIAEAIAGHCASGGICIAASPIQAVPGFGKRIDLDRTPRPQSGPCS